MVAASEASATNRMLRIGDQRDILGECPVWDDQSETLWWVDIRCPAIRRYDPTTLRTETWEMPEMVGAIALTTGDCLVVALGSRIVLWKAGATRFDTIAELPAIIPDHRFNDGRVDRQGRFWVGTMNNITRAPEGTLYRLDGNRLTAVRDGICIPNALSWSPDGNVMYFADSLEHGIDAYDIHGDSGRISNRRRFADCAPPAFPDGAATDTEGHVWYAEFNGGRIVRRAPDGRISSAIETPVDRPTACCFGGPELKTLYVTTASQNMTDKEKAAAPLAGALLAFDVGIAGLPEPRISLPVQP
ncbi:SMP-30/gluconolactonase/LRE family protein [Ruegeria sediminis]|uniref:SMP-30/gluconolactonase/LRE family protein n=1 Tax=Ruegeria sediminis TaxID=2583820 RepID=A0ABY2WT34_9RHOB|nr:SMP-30/gluconolactonase/LRE family protein [Ruegeria sediminis]TMV04232.1 SMP-30/gluconolactonase/LRE family protein [Ruegeria sediminis]